MRAGRPRVEAFFGGGGAGGGISPGPISRRGWRSEVGREVEGVVDGKEMGDDCRVVDALGVPVDMVRHRATMSFRAL